LRITFKSDVAALCLPLIEFCRYYVHLT
jgi:hypothetical protein